MLESVYRSAPPRHLPRTCASCSSRSRTRLGRAWFDRTRLEQILNELLDNAVKFAARGTCLRIRAAPRSPLPTGMQVRIDVEETTAPDSARSTALVVPGFEQVDGSMTRAVGGARYQGYRSPTTLATDAWAESSRHRNRVGFGTTFTLRLRGADTGSDPRRVAASEATCGCRPAPATTAFHRHRRRAVSSRRTR